MRVLIAGVDGYLGWPLAQHLADQGHTVFGIDGLMRRKWVTEMESVSAIPVASMSGRLEACRTRHGKSLGFSEGDLRDPNVAREAVKHAKPDVVVQLGECPSAPYSMIDAEHTVFVQTNNIVGTFNLMFAMKELAPDAALLKLGTMGEYGTPDIDIPEGSFEVEFRGRKATLPFPRSPGSWYHLSKAHGSSNVRFACSLWGLRATDVMQGVVYGVTTDTTGEDPQLLTRLDFDSAFGTAINRFCCQAVIGHPLTLYGGGNQKRGFLPLQDSLRCLTLAIEQPPKAGEYRVLNQFAEVYRIRELAALVAKVATRLGMDATVNGYVNPRVEEEDHYYNPDHQRLQDMGYVPTVDPEAEIERTLLELRKHGDVIHQHSNVLVPDIQWRGDRKRAYTVKKGIDL